MRGERGQRRVQPEHHAVQVHRQDAVPAPGVVVVLAESAAVADPGVQVDEVEPAVRLHGGVDQRPVVLLAGGVAPDEQPAHLLGDGRTAGLVDVRDDDACPEPGEVPRHRRTDSARRPRDHDDLCHVPAP